MPTQNTPATEEAAEFDPELLYAEDENGNPVSDAQMIAAMEADNEEEEEEDESAKSSGVNYLLDGFSAHNNQVYAQQLLNRTRAKTRARGCCCCCGGRR